MPDHTPTPKWRWVDDGVYGVWVIFDEENPETWFQFKALNLEVAKRIVRACNNRDRLVEFAEDVMRFSKEVMPSTMDGFNYKHARESRKMLSIIIEKAQTALTDAEEK